MQAFIFDMDGVLFDTETYFVYALENVLENLGVDSSTVLADIEAFTGKKNDEIALRIKEMYGIDLPGPKITELMDEQFNILLDNGNKIEAFPHTLDFLQAIKNKGFKIGLATGSTGQWVDQVLDGTKTRDFFEQIITGDDVTLAKPDPTIYRLAAEKLAVDSKECVVIEDSPNGIIAAKKLGMKTIGYKGSPIKQDTSLADIEVFDFNEINLEEFN